MLTNSPFTTQRRWLSMALPISRHESGINLQKKVRGQCSLRRTKTEYGIFLKEHRFLTICKIHFIAVLSTAIMSSVGFTYIRPRGQKTWDTGLFFIAIKTHLQK